MGGECGHAHVVLYAGKSPHSLPAGINRAVVQRRGMYTTQLCGVRLRAVVHGKRALSERSQSSATTQRKGGVGDSAANVRRDLTDNDCGDRRGCKLRCFPEQAAGTSASLFLLVAVAESRGSDNLPATELLYSVARQEQKEGRQRGV